VESAYFAGIGQPVADRFLFRVFVVPAGAVVGQLIAEVKMMVKLWMVMFALSWGSASLTADAEVRVGR
jgi:hypothetical protein